ICSVIDLSGFVRQGLAEGLLVVERTQRNFSLYALQRFLKSLSVARVIGQRRVLTQALPCVAEVHEERALALQTADATHEARLRWPLGWHLNLWRSAPPCQIRCSPRCRASCVHQM